MRSLLSLTLAVGLSAPISARAQDTLVVGTYAYATVDRVGAVSPLAAHLSARLGRPTRVIAAPDPVALARLVRDAQVDVVVTNTFGYLLLADGEVPAALPVATFRIPRGVSTNYGTVLVSRLPEVRTMADLLPQTSSLAIALVSPGSTTGNLVPRLFMATQGLADLERQFRTVSYAGTHAATFANLRAGSADVAALATEEFERQLAADGSRAAPRVTVLWRSPDIQLGPVAVRASLPAALRDSIAKAVIGLEGTAASAFTALRGGWTEAAKSDALVAANDQTYDEVRRLFGNGATAAALIAKFAR